MREHRYHVVVREASTDRRSHIWEDVDCADAILAAHHTVRVEQLRTRVRDSLPEVVDDDASPWVHRYLSNISGLRSPVGWKIGHRM